MKENLRSFPTQTNSTQIFGVFFFNFFQRNSVKNRVVGSIPAGKVPDRCVRKGFDEVAEFAWIAQWKMSVFVREWVRFRVGAFFHTAA